MIDFIFISGFHGDLFTNVAEIKGPSLRECEIKIIFEQVAHAVAVSVYKNYKNGSLIFF